MTAISIGTSPSGLFTAAFYPSSGALVFRSPRAVMWKHTTNEACIGCFREIAEAFADDATVADLIWLCQMIDDYDQIEAEHF